MRASIKWASLFGDPELPALDDGQDAYADPETSDGHGHAAAALSASRFPASLEMSAYVSIADTAPPSTGISRVADLPPSFVDAPSLFAWTAPHGNAVHGDVTLLDGAFAAKGGPGGGGPPGGGGGGVLKTYASGSADGAYGYDIQIDFKGTGWTVELQQAFKNAADYFTTVIAYDIGGDARVQKVFVDDLYMTATLSTIDGAGGVLGQSGPTMAWTYTELTATGQMEFDVADAQSYLSRGLWDDIVTHEMMHVLGFGSLWNYGDNGLVAPGGKYDGWYGLQAYKAAGHPGAEYIPVELDGGPGTAGAHWDDATLVNELMTGFINDDGNAATTTDNYLSRFSVESLADLGYAIEYKDYPYDGIVIA